MCLIIDAPWKWFLDKEHVFGDYTKIPVIQSLLVTERKKETCIQVLFFYIWNATPFEYNIEQVKPAKNGPLRRYTGAMLISLLLEIATEGYSGGK